MNEVRTSEVGGIVSLHDIDVTPQITRNFLEFADTIPGMVFTVDGKGNTSIRGGAQIDSNVNVYIDGVGMKDYVSNGGISGQSGATKAGDPGNPFPQLAIAEYKVITSNYSAQYDQVASAAISAETKSGTNTFSGEAFGNFTNQNMRADTPAEIADSVPGNSKVGAASYEFGFAQGGPIIPDVAHFFVTWEHKDLSLPNDVFPPGSNGDTLANLQKVLPADVFSQFGPTTNPFKEDLIFAKIDFEPSDHDRFELTDLTRLETQTVGAAGQEATSAAYDYKNNNNRIALRWQHAADNWVNEARFTYEKAVDSPEQSSTNPAITYQWYESPEINNEAIQINGQDPRSYFHYEQSGPSVQDDFTLNNLNWIGDHTLTFGAKFKSVDLTARDASEGANYLYGVDSAGTAATPYQAVSRSNNPGQNVTADSTDHQFGVYFQDDWVPVERLTLNLGLRWDYETVPSWQDYVLPQNIVKGLYGPRSRGSERDLCTGARARRRQHRQLHRQRQQPLRADRRYQPRLGFSFDFNNDQKHVMFGGWARSYDRNIFDIMSLERTKLALSEPTINFYGSPFSSGGCTAATPSTSCVAWNPAYLNLANLQAIGTGNFGEIDLTNNNLKNPYSDQFSLGIRNRLGDWNTSVAISQINSYNVIIGHLGNRYSNGAYYQNGTQWGAPGVPGFQNLVLWDNSAEDRNFQVGVVFEKPYTKESGWGAKFSYTYSDARQNNPYSYASGNEYAFDLPFPSDYPFMPSTPSRGIAWSRPAAKTGPGACCSASRSFSRRRCRSPASKAARPRAPATATTPIRSSATSGIYSVRARSTRRSRRISSSGMESAATCAWTF